MLPRFLKLIHRLPVGDWAFCVGTLRNPGKMMGSGLLNIEETWRGTPDALEPIEFAFDGAEDMADDIPEIQ